MVDLLVLGDYPAPNDKERAFKDAHGRYLLHLMYINGVTMSRVAFDFCYSNKYDVYGGQSRISSIMSTHKPKVILALGQQVMKELAIDGALSKMRGSVLEERLGNHAYYVIPTFNPRDLKQPARMFADEPVEKGFYCSIDVQRAWTVVQDGWEVPEERFNLEPTFDEVMQFCDRAEKERSILGLDIEATGLNTDYAEIVTLGIAINESECLVVPFKTQGGQNYWHGREGEAVKERIEKLFKTNRMLFQNGVGYDIPLLTKRGWNFPIEQFTDDTMVMHHVLSPELPHNIGFISAQYGKQPYWKADMKMYLGNAIYEAPDIPGDPGFEGPSQQNMRRYNARDCVALHQIRNGMIREMNRLIDLDSSIYGSLPDVYSRNMEASWASIEMSLQGVNISEAKLRQWQKYIREELDKIEKELSKAYPLPKSFNWSSPHHKRYLIYGEEPPALKSDKWRNEMRRYTATAKNYQYYCTECSRKVTQKYYDYEEVKEKISKKCPACKVVRDCLRTPKEPTSVKAPSKESKKYKDLEAIAELASIKPLPLLKNYRPLSTDTGQTALDGAAIARYIKHIENRFVEIDNMKRMPPRCVAEKKNLEVTLEVLKLVKKQSKYKKLVESFWDFPTGIDGKVHPQFLVTGTASGRWSCKGPNLQQVPSGEIGTKIRSVFKASKGHTLLGIDYSNLEVQVGARVFGDMPLIEMLESGLNMHDENTKIFFGIEPTDPRWNKLRKVSKIIMFGRLLYGGSDRGIYNQVMTAVPDCGLTFKAFCEAVENYFDAHPEFKLWCTEVQNLAKEKSISINAFGRVRTLLGSADAITRQALNSPIQGSAADVARDAIIDIRRELRRRNLKSKIILAVHDEILMDVLDSELKEVYGIMKEAMNKEIKVGLFKFRIPIDAEIGTYWGDMGSFSERTMKRTGGSKH